ncbi:hypothetical protein [Streptomyces sp. NRRL F-5727]|uniref:hypothetical protein n=1 Tax=Streptomyces sp. NRRL F-5727 TaxID=1463871 RepID=UPI00131B2A98|nr:hypothetical protein [Streptomyces sp. NRRL F-5727]
MKTATRTGPPSFGRILMVATGMLMLELTSVAVVAALYGATREPATGDGYGFTVMMLPLVALPATLVVAVAALVLVVPAVVLAAELGRRLGGAPEGEPGPWWWTPVSAAPVAAAGVLFLLRAVPSPRAALLAWAALVVLIVPAALVARLRRRWLLREIALWGTVGLMGLAVTGGLVLGSGVLDAHEPPVATREELVGTWTDGRGGTLELAADGTAEADGVMEPPGFAPLPGEAGETCTARGTWTFAAADGWGESVVTDLPDCVFEPWEIGGEDDRVVLRQWDVDGEETVGLSRAG